MTLDRILDIIQVITSTILVILVIVDITERRKENGKPR